MKFGNIRELLIGLKELKNKDSSLLSSINNFNLMISALEELDGLVEMENVKKMVISQIKFLLVNSVFLDKSNFEGHMLHTVIAGSPGTGKTQLGIILAKIWTSLGLVGKSEKEGDSKADSNSNPKADSNSNPKADSNSNPKADSDPKTNPTVNEENIHNNSSENNFKICNNEISELAETIKMKNGIIKTLQNYIFDIKQNINSLNLKLSLFHLKNVQGELFKLNNCLLGKYNLNILEKNIFEIDEYRKKLERIYKTQIPEETIETTEERSRTTITFKNEEFCIEDIERIKQEITQLMKKKDVTLEREREKEKKDVTLEMEDIEIQPKKFDGIRIVSREDFVGGFLGQTAIKTEKLLRDTFGKVLFIDEAYSLVQDDRDSYGKEALTVLNRFMSEFPDKLIIIFAGYADMLEKTIFHYQPGLRRRCSWHFQIESYTEKGLGEIFLSQLKRDNWLLNNDIDITNFFSKNISRFPNYGGDTLRLAFYCKLIYANEVFDNQYPNEKVINKNILEKALESLISHQVPQKESQIPLHIYL